MLLASSMWYAHVATRGHGHAMGGHRRDPGLHLAAPSGVNPVPRSRLPDDLVTAAFLVDVTTGRDRARSGVDAVRCRRDDLRPAGMTRSRPQPGLPARSRRPIGTAQPGGRQAVGSWAVCRPAVSGFRARWARLEDVEKVLTERSPWT